MRLTMDQTAKWRNDLLRAAGSGPLLIDDIFATLDQLVVANGAQPVPTLPDDLSDEQFEAAIVDSFMQALDVGPQVALKRVILERGKLASDRRQDVLIRKWIEKLQVGSDGFLDVESAIRDLESRLIR